jgi:hypothetical protein
VWGYQHLAITDKWDFEVTKEGIHTHWCIDSEEHQGPENNP